MFTALMIVAGIVLGAAGFYAYLRFYYLPRYKEKMLWGDDAIKKAAEKGAVTAFIISCKPEEFARLRKKIGVIEFEECCDASGSYKCGCCNSKEMP